MIQVSLIFFPGKDEIMRLSAPQGSYGLSENGQEIESLGQKECHNITVVNLEKRTTLMLHVWQSEYGGINPDQWKALTQFAGPLGPKSAVIVEGDCSVPSLQSRLALKELGIDPVIPVHVKSGGQKWDLVFSPESRRLSVKTREGAVLYDDVPLPAYTAVPEHEKGLTDERRRSLRLWDAARTRNGELTKKDLWTLHELMTPEFSAQNYRFSPLSRLMTAFVTARAKKAGYVDYIVI